VDSRIAPARKSNKGVFVEKRESSSAEGGESGYYHLLSLKTQVGA
jgi:hypothetical protein